MFFIYAFIIHTFLHLFWFWWPFAFQRAATSSHPTPDFSGLKEGYQRHCPQALMVGHATGGGAALALPCPQLPASRMLQAVDTIGGLQVSWSLGAMTKAIGSWNLNCTLVCRAPSTPPRCASRHCFDTRVLPNS